jgi:8-oxo-dGTP pyrophosphatase MutT (NUDIX family)
MSAWSFPGGGIESTEEIEYTEDQRKQSVDISIG